MEETTAQALCRQLANVDQSLEFIGVLMVSVALSWRATAIQREWLCRIGRGEAQSMPDVYPIRLPASLLVVTALTFFFQLALEGWQGSREGSCRTRESAKLNLWAALFVLAAALIRLYDLTCVQEREV